jgi:hypothetical protein
MKKINTYNIDWKLVSIGLGLPPEKTFEMFNDGRMLGRLGEFLHANSENGERQNENSSFDVKEKNNIKSEVRTITDKVSFASSKEIGYGRKVTEKGFSEKLNSIDRFILIDKRLLFEGSLDMIEITKEDLSELSLGINKSISAKKFYEKYDRNEQNIQ